MLGPDIRLEWLVSFLAVVDEGNFSSAAAAIHRSQPRVSMHVASLEREVGLPLFDRRRRPVALTEAGTALARHARDLLRLLETAEEEMAQRRGAGRGVVVLGSYPSASAAFVPQLLRQFAQTSPDVRVVLVEYPTLDLDRALGAGEIDLCLRPAVPAPVTASIHREPLWREPLVVLHSQDHPLASLPDPLPLTAVARHPLITIGRLDRPDSAQFEPHELFRRHGLELEPVQATNQPQTLVSLVREGLGIGVINALAAQVSDTTGVTVRRLPGAYRRVVVAWDAANRLTPAARALLTAVRSTALPAGTTRAPRRTEPPAGDQPAG